jgi:hypothetical protein
MEMAGRIREFILAAGGGVSSLRIAEKFLRISCADELLARKLLSPILESGDLTYKRETGWDPGPARPGSEAMPTYSCSIPALADDVPMTACTVGVSETGRSPNARCRIRSVHIFSVNAPPRDSFSGELEGKWATISSRLDGTEAIFLNGIREAAPLLDGLARRNLPGPARTRSLLSAVRGAVRLPRGSQLEEIARLLSCALLEPIDGSAVASNIATCLKAARRQRQEKVRCAELEYGSINPLPAEHPVLNGKLLDTTPAGPGTYRFMDAEGSVLYVGKSSNLRRRLGEYIRSRELVAAPDRKRKVMSELHRVARVEVEPSGSDLEAVLREADLIRKNKPEANVQRRVHARKGLHSDSRLCCYLLPALESGAVSALIVEDGEFRGCFRIGPRGGGLAAAREIIEASFGRRNGTQNFRVGESMESSTRLVGSWLSRERDSLSRIDLEGCAEPDEAMELLKRAAREEARGAGEAVYYMARGQGVPPDHRKKVREPSS